MNYLSMAVERFGNDYIDGTINHIRYNCPFCEKRRHKPDYDRKLYVNYVYGWFYCFKCHAKGKLSYGNYTSTVEVYEKIKQFIENSSSAIDNNRCMPYNGVTSETDEEDNMFYVPDVRIAKGTLAYEYCIARGITEDMINFYNIRLGTDNLFGRIVIPNSLYNGIWTDMYSARSYIGQTPKYLNPPECDKSNIVFNIQNIKEGDEIYVVEGVITAIMAGKTAVAVYGCHPSKTQIDMILEKKPSVINCVLDNDSAGRGANEELARQIADMTTDTDVYLVYMPYGKDAADLGEKEFQEYVRRNRVRSYNNVYSALQSYVEVQRSKKI